MDDLDCANDYWEDNKIFENSWKWPKYYDSPELLLQEAQERFTATEAELCANYYVIDSE